MSQSEGLDDKQPEQPSKAKGRIKPGPAADSMHTLRTGRRVQTPGRCSQMCTEGSMGLRGEVYILICEN